MRYLFTHGLQPIALICRESRITGCRWELNDPLFWPKRVWILITLGIFTVSIGVSGITWTYVISAYRSSMNEAESSFRDIVTRRRIAWVQHQQWLVEKEKHQQDLLRIKQQVGTPLEPLAFISSRATSSKLVMTHLSPVKAANDALYNVSLEGSFAGLMAFLFAPMTEHLWQIKAGRIESHGEHIDADGQPVLRMDVQIGWWQGEFNEENAFSPRFENGGVM